MMGPNGELQVVDPRRGCRRLAHVGSGLGMSVAGDVVRQRLPVAVVLVSDLDGFHVEG